MHKHNVLQRVQISVIKRWAFACVTRVSEEEVMSSAGTRPWFCHPVFELTDVNFGYFMSYISNILGGLDTLGICLIELVQGLSAACRLSYWLLIHHPWSCIYYIYCHLVFYWQNKQNWTPIHSNRFKCYKLYV